MTIALTAADSGERAAAISTLRVRPAAVVVADSEPAEDPLSGSPIDRSPLADVEVVDGPFVGSGIRSDGFDDAEVASMIAAALHQELAQQDRITNSRTKGPGA